MTHTIGWLRAILVAASLAAIVLVVTGLMAGAEQQGSHGWTYDTATGVVTASAGAESPVSSSGNAPTASDTPTPTRSPPWRRGAGRATTSTPATAAATPADP